MRSAISQGLPRSNPTSEKPPSALPSLTGAPRMGGQANSGSTLARPHNGSARNNEALHCECRTTPTWDRDASLVSLRLFICAIHVVCRFRPFRLFLTAFPCGRLLNERTTLAPASQCSSMPPCLSAKRVGRGGFLGKPVLRPVRTEPERAFFLYGKKTIPKTNRRKAGEKA